MLQPGEALAMGVCEMPRTSQNSSLEYNARRQSQVHDHAAERMVGLLIERALRLSGDNFHSVARASVDDIHAAPPPATHHVGAEAPDGRARESDICERAALSLWTT